HRRDADGRIEAQQLRVPGRRCSRHRIPDGGVEKFERPEERAGVRRLHDLARRPELLEGARLHLAVIRLTVAILAAVLFAFIIVPLLGLIAHLGGQELSAVSSPVALAAFRLSLVTTTIALVVTLILGTPLAYVLARANFPGRAIVDAIVDLPIVIPP